MMVLMILACFTVHQQQDDCRPIVLSEDFADSDSCAQQSVYRVIAYLTTHHGVRIKHDTKPICTTSSQFILYGFDA